MIQLAASARERELFKNLIRAQQDEIQLLYRSYLERRKAMYETRMEEAQFYANEMDRLIERGIVNGGMYVGLHWDLLSFPFLMYFFPLQVVFAARSALGLKPPIVEPVVSVPISLSPSPKL